MASKLLKYFFVSCFIIYCINYWLQNKTYIVDTKDLVRITKKHIGKGKDVNQMFAGIEGDLRKIYGRHIIDKKDMRWIFINCGGWMGTFYLLHASLTEYILFFGTSIDTSGHSGRYWANFSDTVISGSFKQWPEGQLEAKTYGPGDTVIHLWGETAAVQWTAGTYMVEYGRGFIPSTLTFALADTIFSTTDVVTLFQIMQIYSKALINEAGSFIDEMFSNS